jgi:sRNA-binding regulator protein Hfq
VDPLSEEVPGRPIATPCRGFICCSLIASFDGFTVLLVRDGLWQLVYKHAISTIMPASDLKLYEG